MSKQLKIRLITGGMYECLEGKSLEYLRALELPAYHCEGYRGVCIPVSALTDLGIEPTATDLDIGGVEEYPDCMYFFLTEYEDIK